MGMHALHRTATKRRARQGQRGISLFGLLFWGVLIAFTAVVVMRVAPTVMEYYTIQRAIDRIAKSNPPTVPAARDDFERTRQIEYSIVSITPADLVISKDNERVKISFAYEKQVPLAGPVFLLIKYEGQSH